MVLYQPNNPEYDLGYFCTLPAERLDQVFFLFLGVRRQRIQRRNVPANSGSREQHERFSRQPPIASPSSQPQDERADAKKQDLRGEGNQHSHSGLPLPVYLAKLQLARKTQG